MGGVTIYRSRCPAALVEVELVLRRHDDATHTTRPRRWKARKLLRMIV